MKETILIQTPQAFKLCCNLLVCFYTTPNYAVHSQVLTVSEAAPKV